MLVEADRTAANLETVKAMYAAFGLGDVERLIAALSPDVEWAEPENPFNPAAGVRHGVAGFLEWLRIGKESEDILELAPRRYVAQDDTVAVVGHTRCVAKPTGKSYETDFVHLVTLRDGKITRFQEFFDTWAAAEAFRP